MENLNPILTLLVGAFGSFILYWFFPDIRRAKVGREHAESDKVSAESDSIQLGAIAEFLLTTTQNTVSMSQIVQANANDYAAALKKVADTNIEMMAWVREKEIQMSEERHLLIGRIEELSLKLRQLDEEKSALEDDLAAAKIKIDKLETDSTTQSKELKQLEKDYRKLRSEYDTLKAERDQLLLQMANASMPQLAADNLETHILSKDGKDNETPSTSHFGSTASDSVSS